MARAGEKRKGFNRELLCKLLDEIKGDDRNYAQFAAAAGISKTTVSKLYSDDSYYPSKKLLIKLRGADPRGDVNVKMLLQAAGFDADDEDDFELTEEAVADVSTSEMETGSDDSASHTPGIQPSVHIELSPSKDNRHMERMLEYHDRFTRSAYERMMKGFVLAALTEQGIAYTKLDQFGDDWRLYQDLALNIQDQVISKWYFEYKYFAPGESISDHRIWMALTNILRKKLPEDAKQSIVLNNKEVYKRLIKYAGELPYRGELSIILMDIEESAVIDETYLSHYYEEDYSKEIYIVKMK